MLTLPEPVTLRANGRDVFTSLVVPFPGTQARTLKAIQIRASDPQAVRSVLLSFDEKGKLQQSEGWRQGIAGMETPEGATSSAAGLIFWSPAAQALKPRADEDWTVKPGSNLVLATHLKTTGKKLALQFEIGLYYAEKTTSSTGRAAVMRLQRRGPIEITARTCSQFV